MKHAFSIIATTLLLLSGLSAQQLDGLATIGVQGGGYNNPVFQFGLSQKTPITGRFVFEGEQANIPHAKTFYGGNSFGLRGVVFYRFNHWLIGGGDEYCGAVNQSYSKFANHPVAAFGYDAERWAWRSHYYFVGTDEHNAVQGFKGRYIYGKQDARFRPYIEGEVFGYHVTDNPNLRRTYGGVSFGMLIRLAGKRTGPKAQ